MTAPSSIDPAHFLHEQLAQASPDLLRQMLTTFINALMSAEADAVCGAGYGERSPERTNVRNGYRPREFDTRAGTLELAIPGTARAVGRRSAAGRHRCRTAGSPPAPGRSGCRRSRTAVDRGR